MEEPSVLDYLKAKLMPWRGPAPEILALTVEKSKSKAKVKAKGVKAKAASKPKAEAIAGPFPWRTPLVLLLLIGAQMLWQAPEGGWLPGTMVALGALAMIVWAAREGDWRLPKASERELGEPALVVRYVPLALSLVFFAITFASSGGNQFTVINVLSWIVSILFGVLAFWQRDEVNSHFFENLKESFSDGKGGIRLSGWQLLWLAAFAVAAFFRLYQLGDVPLEMVSDHAEKLLDVGEVLNGNNSIFFPRNTGREPLQFYLTAAIVSWLGTGLSFISLKIGTAVLGLLSLIYVYLLGKEFGGRWVGLLAMLMMGMAYWPNVLARTGLRFILYPAFAAPALYYLVRGLRFGKINHFLLAGVFVGVGLFGYTAFRIVPVIFVIALIVFLLHKQTVEVRKKSVASFVVLGLLALLVFTPLLRNAVEEDSFFSYRMLTRIGSLETELPGPALQIFLSNVWNGLGMIVNATGSVWLVGLANRPALDLISGALFLLGVPLLVIRYLRKRDWRDMFWLLSGPLLMLPSMLSLAFPEENPALNRAGAAAIPIFLIAAYALDALVHGIKDRIGPQSGLRVAQFIGAGLLLLIAGQNYDLVFREYAEAYAQASWNSSEIGKDIFEFSDSLGAEDSVWVVSFPHWVDTRLVGINAGFATRDFGIWPDQMEGTLSSPRPKLFLLNLQDVEGLDSLQTLYPDGRFSVSTSQVPGKEYVRYFVP